MQNIRIKTGRTNRRNFLRFGTLLGTGWLMGGPGLAQSTAQPAGGPDGLTLPSAKPEAGLQVATFCCDLTPPKGTPIYSSYAPLATIEHPLLAKGVVLEDRGSRYVLCAVDYCELCNSTHRLFRQKLAEGAGTRIEQVAVQTIHQHTAPMADADADQILLKCPNPPFRPDPKLYNTLADRLRAAVQEARTHSVPVTEIGLGEGRVERVASTRRCRTADGKIVVRWSGGGEQAVRDLPEGWIDPMVKTITFARSGQPIVRLHYYATHPQTFYGDPRATYDFPGMAREKLQDQEKVFQIYFTGCGGDITVGKYNDRTPEARAQLAERLLAGMHQAIEATRYHTPEPIVWRTASVRLQPRKDPGYTEADCRAILENPQAAPASRMYQGAMRLAFLLRAEQPFELSAFSMGRLHVVHLPGEPMLEFQSFAQKQRPEDFVAVAGDGDCACGYICTQAAFQEGGYEPTDSMVVPESETELKKAIRHLLGLHA